MSGANTLDLNGGTDTLNFGSYTDPTGGHVPGPVVVNNSPGNQTLNVNVSWAYVTESGTLTTDSLIINRFTQGDTLDYTPSGVSTAVGGEQASLQSLAPNGSIADLGTFSVDGLSVVGLQMPVIETKGDLSTTAANIDFLLVPGPSGIAFAISDLLVSGDGAQGIDITTTQPCYCAGTRIRTPSGEVAIEDLRPGDLVVTARSRSAAPQPVVWVGHRTVDCAMHPRPWDVLPVRVQAHAFGPGRPRRDLWLSPDHAVFADGVLIPVRYLINGASLAQQHLARVTYYHLELSRHDVVLAEGLPAESFLDTGNRAAFANGGSVVQAAPDFARRVWAAAGCAPLVTVGTAVARIRKRLIARLPLLGHALTRDPRPTFLLDGRPAQAQRFGTDGWSVAIPAAAGTLRLRSRAARPADLDPHSDDTRLLGMGCWHSGSMTATSRSLIRSSAPAGTRVSGRCAGPTAMPSSTLPAPA